MNLKDNSKILLDNRTIFEQNLCTLYNLRPKETFEFKGTERSTSYNLKNNKKVNVEDIINKIQSLNAAIIVACYSYFESCFETLILDNLSLENLNKEQERIVTKYIDDVIKLSNIEKYEKEFQLVNGTSLKDLFTKNEMDNYEVIKELYTLRHLIIHGSTSKRVYIESENKTFGRFVLDENNNEIQRLITFIKNQTKVDIHNNQYSLGLILLNSQLVDILFESTKIITSKFNSKIKNKFKVI